MYKYHNPSSVKSPRHSISQVKPLFDGGIGDKPYSIAKITWQGADCIGIRWNVSNGEWDDDSKKSGEVTCLGEPNSRGYPTWFVLPNMFLQELVSGEGNLFDRVRGALEEISSK